MPLFYNKLVLRGNKVVKHHNFPELSGIIDTISDFFNPSTNEMLSKDQFCIKFSCNISLEKYIDIRYTIGVAIQKLGLPKHRIAPAPRPFQPFIIDIILSSKKGCGTYNRLLKKNYY